MLLGCHGAPLHYETHSALWLDLYAAGAAAAAAALRPLTVPTTSLSLMFLPHRGGRGGRGRGGRGTPAVSAVAGDAAAALGLGVGKKKRRGKKGKAVGLVEKSALAKEFEKVGACVVGSRTGPCGGWLGVQTQMCHSHLLLCCCGFMQSDSEKHYSGDLALKK